MDNEIKECCDWLKCQLYDIRTFLSGIEKHIEGDKSQYPGGGNLSVPILIYAYIEFISALYRGKSAENSTVRNCPKCKRKHSDYNATENVKSFVEKFFQDNYKNYPLIFWDGIRNAIIHRFSPKVMTKRINNIQYTIRFQFYVDDKNTSAYAKAIDNHIFININVFELFEIIQNATKDYFSILEYDSDLQKKCLEVWRSIKQYSRDITSDEEKNREAENLISAITAQSSIYILKNQ